MTYLLPLSMATGGGIAAQAENAEQQAQAAYASNIETVTSALQITAAESAAARPDGEILCWQLADESVRESSVYTDNRGNTYLQDEQGKLKVIKLDRGFKLRRQAGEWQSRRLATEAQPAGTLW